RASRPVARCRRSSSRSSTRRPARAASIVIRTSQPKPGAKGKHVSRASGESARWPESGSHSSIPPSTLTRVRALRFAIPKPPPSRRSNAAIARSASLSSSGARSPTRSASQSTRRPGGASRSASVSAWPLPRRGSRTTVAPARSASSAVASYEPSSASTTSACGNAARSDATVVPIRPSSSRAATRTTSGSATRDGREGRHRRQCAVARRILHAVLAGRRALQQQHERELADPRVDVVDAREAGLTIDGRRRLRGIGLLDPDRRNASRAEALVESEEEACRRAALRRVGAYDDDAVRRCLVPAQFVLDERFGERVPERSVAANCKLLSELAPQRVEVALPAEPGGGGLILDRRLDLPYVERHLQRAQAELLCAGVVQRAVDGGGGAAVVRPDVHDGDLLALQAVADERRVRLVDEALGRLAVAREVGRLGCLVVEPLLQARELVLEELRLRSVDEATVGDPDADQDPDDQREEDGRERGDVVAKVKHGLRAPRQSGTGRTAA